MACQFCPRPLHEHGKTRVFPDDGPPGSSHWRYDECPSDDWNDIRESFSNLAEVFG